MFGFIRRWLWPGPSPQDAANLRATVRERFRRIATAPQREQRAIGPAVAAALGYDPAELAVLPLPAMESFAGVGNPLSLGELRPGETVLDLGCGAGLDSLLAARRVSPSGSVLGIDLTAEMARKGQQNAGTVGFTNVHFLVAAVEKLPLASGTIDVAICNGLFNLCPDKPAALAEVYRVLKPGGGFQAADVLLEGHVTAEEVARRGAWSE